MTWNVSDLRALGEVDEVGVASTRNDGTLRPFVTIWGVRIGDDLYIRSADGASNGWFRRAVASGTGRIRGGGVQVDVTFTLVDPVDDVHALVDAAYHAKYDRYGARIVATVVGPDAAEVTLRVSTR